MSSVLFLYGAASRIPARYGFEYGEGIVMWQAAHVTSPSEAYHPIETYPYVVFHYPPGFHLVSRLAGRVTGDLLVGGRLVTLCSALVIMFTLGAVVFRSQAHADPTVRWLGALTAAFLPAVLPNVHDWVPHMRVDVFGLTLTLLSLWAFLEARSRPALRYVAFVGFVTALYAKQTLLSAPLAALIVVAIDSRTEAVKLAGVAAIVGLIPLVAMQWATNGQFALHLFVHNQNTYEFDRAVDGWWSNLQNAAPVLALAATAAVTRLQNVSAVTVRCLSIYALFAFLMSWTSGKFGSASNYFLEVNLIGCVFAGLAVSAAAEQWRQSRIWAVAVAVLVVVAGGLQLPQIANDSLKLTSRARALAAAQADEARQALELVRQTPGPVFSWDLMVLMLANKEIPLEPAIMFELSKSGEWDITPFLEQIRDGYYGLIVANSYTEWLPSDTVSQAMQFRYAPAERFGSYHLYRPVRR